MLSNLLYTRARGLTSKETCPGILYMCYYYTPIEQYRADILTSNKGE